MNETKHDQWGPDDELGRRIADVPYPDTSPELTHRIMAPLKPLRPGLGRRLLMWFNEPLTIRLSPALALLLFAVIFSPTVIITLYHRGGESVNAKDTEQAIRVPVVFQYGDKAARSVALMGSFNRWNPKGHELVWQPELEQWTLKLHLAPGKYDYVFLVNGEKVAPDPAADLIQADDFGNRNSVIFIKGNNGLHY